MREIHQHGMPVLLCLCLLAAPQWCSPQTVGGAIGGSLDATLKTHLLDAPPPSIQGTGFLLGEFPGDPARPPASVSITVPEVWIEALAFAPDTSQSNNQTPPAPPPSQSAPSLEGLGFPPSVIRGSAREQALLEKRSHMLQIHQKLGLLTTIPLIATVFTGPGAKGHHGLPGNPTGRDVHAALGAVTAGMYFTSAYFAIRAPKVPGTKSYGLIRMHKAMAWIHFPGMILTATLGAIAFSQLSHGERVHGIAKYHAIVAYTTVIAYGVSILSVTFK